MAFYKYRSLQDLKRFLDILINNRLYMAQYDAMNDPVEGIFLSNENSRDIANDLIEGKRQKRMCCLSRNYNHTLLWSHYADGHKGCCLEVEVARSEKPYEVRYDNVIPRIDGEEDMLYTILTHKSSLWCYEDEVRFFKDVEFSSSNKQRKSFLKIKIKRVFLGYKMNSKEESFYTKLIQSLLGESVEVRKIRKDEIDFGFNK